MNPLINYFIEIYRLHKRFMFWVINSIEEHSSRSIALQTRNLINKLKGLNHRFFFDESALLYYVEEKGRKHYFGNKRRGFQIYYYGIDVRAQSLGQSYMLDMVNFFHEDIVIDCGANYADIILFLNGRIKQENYITFEPGTEEFSVISKNAPHSKNFNMGLGDQNINREFFLNTENADSSIIEPPTYSKSINVRLTNFDSFIKDNGISRIKLFKVEAEGFEPEVLKGASEFITVCEYVAIDGGYERGKTQEETFSYQVNFLLRRNFEMIGVNLKQGRALFRNKKLINKDPEDNTTTLIDGKL